MNPFGIAVNLGPAAPAFYAGSTRFKLYPSMSEFEEVDAHVVVAFTPGAVDHGLPETTIFRCASDGSRIPGMGLDDGAEVLSNCERIIGRYDADAALANLSSGYYQVSEAECRSLKPGALRSARDCAQNQLSMSRRDANDYARNNWGMFAARAVAKSHGRPAMLRTINNVFGARARHKTATPQLT